MKREMKKKSGRQTIVNRMNRMIVEGKLMREACMYASFEQSKIVRERQNDMYQKFLFLKNYTKAADNLKN